MPSTPTQFLFKTISGVQVPFTQEVIVQSFQPIRPFPQNPSAIVYRARIAQLRAHYARPSYNTPHPNLPQVYFADDADFQDRTSGLVEWTRTWVTLPESWDDFESYAYTYPGLSWNLSTTGRAPMTRTVTAKKRNDYFMVGPLPTFTAGFAAYDDFANAAWVKQNASSTANARPIPQCAGGANIAAKVFESAASGVHSVSQNYAVGAGQVWAAVFLNAAGRDRALVRLNDGGEIANVAVDLSTGNLNQPAGNWGTIAEVGEGWYRIGLSGIAANGTTALQVVLMNNSNAISYAGDNSSGMYMWRGQIASGGALPHATVPPTVSADNVNYPYNSADQIKVTNATLFLYNPNGIGVPNGVVVEYLGVLSVPNYQTYYNANTSWVNTDNANANSYSIEATDSQLNLWLGTTWVRERMFVKAR